MLIAFTVYSILVAIAVMIHYEILYRLSRLMPTLHIKHLYRPVIGVFGALTAHITEIWFFAFGYYFLSRSALMDPLIAFDSGESIHGLYGLCLLFVYYLYHFGIW